MVCSFIKGIQKMLVNFATNKTNWNNFTTAQLTTPEAIRDKDGDDFRDIV
jgi:hypothetical protein